MLLALSLVTAVGQVAFGLGAYNEERVQEGHATVTLLTYLTSGHFLEAFEGDEDPREHRNDEGAPWPVRRGGWVSWIYERSLAAAFAVLFLLSFVVHAFGGLMQNNEERSMRGLPSQGLFEFIASSQFWFDSFQNWQSEFLAVLSIVVLTIFLRHRGSPQSKAVAAPHAKTGS